MLEHELMNLGILFFFAILGGLIAVKMRQPAVIGLLLIGSIIGPNMFGLVNDYGIINMMAELGSILLLFVIGLEFVIPKLAKIGFKALMIGVMKIGIIFFMTYELSLLFGISPHAAIIFGIMLSISSTVVIVKILESKGLYQRQEMPLIIGILLIEDIFAVVVLAFLSGTKANTGMMPIIENLILALTVLVVVYLVMLKVTKKIVPKLLEFSNEETVTFLALGICAAFSYLAYYLGLLPATGAFLAGSIVASLPEVKLFEHAIRPYTLTFSSLFFISIGAMVNFSTILSNLPLLIFFVIVIIISRLIAVGSMGYLFANLNRQQTIFSSIAMISVGEFSLLISQAAMGLNLGYDFVSISASIIFITALLMSVFISSYEKVTDLVVTSQAGRYHKPRVFSNFMKSLSDEIDMDNSHSNTFKKVMLETMLVTLLFFFAFIIWHRLLIIQSLSFIARLGIHVVFFFVLFGLIALIYQKTRQMHRTIAQMISNLYFFGNIERSKSIVTNLVLALFLLLVTVFSPVLVVLFRMPPWINLASLILLILVLARFKLLFNMVHYASSKSVFFPKYKKIAEYKFDITRN